MVEMSLHCQYQNRKVLVLFVLSEDFSYRILACNKGNDYLCGAYND